MQQLDRIIIAVTVTCIAVAVVSACTLATTGQMPAESPLVYSTWENFTTRDGLPHNSIRAVRVADDRVWVGTEGGLALYDGRTFRSWTANDGLGSPVVTAIDLDTHTDEVWIGTWGGGLVRFSAGRFDRFTQMNSGLAGDLVFDVRVAGGRIWTATNAGISSFDPANDAWELHFQRRADAPEVAFTSLAVHRGCLYAAGSNGEVKQFDLDHNKWSSVAGPVRGLQPCSQKPRCFHRGALGMTNAAGFLWLLTEDQLCRWDGALEWEASNISAGPNESYFFRCLSARSESEAWLGKNNGLRALIGWPVATGLRYHRLDDDTGIVTLSRQGGTLAAKVARSTLPDNRIRCIAFDRDTIWVGTVNGLSRGGNLQRWNSVSSFTEGKKTARSQAATTALRAQKADGDAAASSFVTVALLGPIVRPIALPGEHQRRDTDVGRADPLAVQLALDQTNTAEGGRGKTPVLLATGAGEYERYGWGSPEDDFALFLHRDKALGIVAHVGPDQIIRSAVTLRTEVPVVNTSSEPPGTAELANPWIFRCPVDDPRQHARMMDYIVNDLGHTRIAVFRGPDPVARRHLGLWIRYAQAHALSHGGSVVQIDYDPNSDQLDDALRKLARCDAHVVLTWYDEVVSASVVRRMRELEMVQLFVGSEHVVSDEFPELAGRNPGPVMAFHPCPHRRDRELLARFVKRYTAQSSSRGVKREPTIDAYVAYHATCHLLEAIDLAGSDRDAVRQMLAEMGKSRLAVLKDGQWQTVTPSDRPTSRP